MERIHSFGYWLRRRRKALDLTQAELAQRASCSLDLIRKIESDARRPSRQMAEKLADVLAIDAAERAAFVQAARAERSVDQLDVATQPVEQPQRSSHTNLPAQLTALIGREQEVATITSLMRRPDVRLLTLTGPGGIGKTRLSLQVATELLGNFAHGVYLVDLAPIREPALVLNQIATTLCVKQVGSQPLLATLKDYLGDKHILLLLDNFEQVIDAAPQVAELLASVAQLKLLVTSREVLKLRGEKKLAVPPLALPSATQVPPLERLLQYAAVSLFIERALDARPDFEVTNTNAPAVVEICARLDGLPLAIELAAARAKLFAPETLLARLSSRLTLLTGGPRDLPARQQTIRSTIAWSYELLSEDEQALFRRLGVFVGGWTVEAAEAVTTFDVVDGIAALLDKSLVRQAGRDTERFTMLETIREYALERLEASGEAEELGQRHAQYYFTYADGQHARQTQGNNTFSEFVNNLSREHDNLWAALAWSQSMAGDSEMALRLACIAVAGNLVATGYEGLRVLRCSLNHPLGVGRTRAHVATQIQVATIFGVTGDRANAERHCKLALELAREIEATDYQAVSLYGLGWVARERGDTVSAWASFTEALVLLRALSQTSFVSTVLNSMGEVAIIEEDPDRAEALLAEALALTQDFEETGWTLNHLGHAAQLRGQFERAADLYQQSLASFGEDYIAGVIETYQCLGECALGRGQISEAVSWLAPSLRLSHKVQIGYGIAWCIASLGSAAALDGEPERAARLWSAAEKLRQSVGYRPAPATRATYERAMALARAQLGEEAFAEAWAAGQALTLEQAIAEALGAGD